MATDCQPNIVIWQVAAGNEGVPVDLKSVRKVELTDRMQCDCCAACITDIHRTCSKCGDYDTCIRCCRSMRQKQDVREAHPSVAW